MSSIRGWPQVVGLVLLEARPQVLAIGGMRFLIGALLSAGAVVSLTWLTGLTAWLLLTTSVYVLNGVTDMESDRINGSGRPVAAGRLGVHTARRAVWVTASVAVALSMTVSWSFALHLVLALGLGLWYSLGSRPAKANSFSAFLAVVVGGLLTYHAGLVAADGHMTVPYLVASCCMSLWMGVGSMFKDLTDIPGDLAAGRKTLAVLHGPAVLAGLAISVAALIAAVMTFVAYWPQVEGVTLRGVSLLLIAGILAMVVACTRVTFLRTKWPYRIFMYTQYAVHGDLALRI